MKTKQLTILTLIFLCFLGWNASMRAQDIPANYTQNPNMEHDLNSIFWYGSWDPSNTYISTNPAAYLSMDDAHSGKSCFNIIPGAYVWVSYPCRGQEEKKMKASFWYKGYFNSYWNFIYRDLGMTFDDLPPELAEYQGADTAFYGGAGQPSLQFTMGGEDSYTEDWTYFEFVWDMPGTIPGWGNTTMWFAEYEPAYVDDFYYGEWYDGQYAGEEPFGFINSDFELEEINIEWTLNVAPWDNPGKNDYLSWTENHTDAGLQSLRIMDFTSKDTATDVVSNVDRNLIYQIPSLGAKGKTMDLSFWYKGKGTKLGLNFYKDYDVTTNEFPLPAGSTLFSDSANVVYNIDTLSITIDTLDTFIDTFMVTEKGNYNNILELQIDTITLNTQTQLASQNFDNESSLKLTDGAWVWSGSDFYGWDDWAAATKATESFSKPEALWLPGDPSWGGAEGYINVEDNKNYIWEFKYIGKLQFILKLGSATKYDLVADPDGIVPADATADAGAITWQLDSEYWTNFRFEYAQGSWLADSSVTSPAKVGFNMIGTYTGGDVGYVDDFMVATGTVINLAVIDTNYVVIDANYTTSTTYEIDTVSTTYPQAGAMWELPAVAEWTEWKLRWTNPNQDIGSTLTLVIDPTISNNPDLIIPGENEQFNDDHADWTYFDDFSYGISVGIRNDLVKNDLHTYPNPASDILYLSLEIPLKQVVVFNSLGQKVINENNPTRKINVADLPSGIYLINVKDLHGTIHQSKFIKE